MFYRINLPKFIEKLIQEIKGQVHRTNPEWRFDHVGAKVIREELPNPLVFVFERDYII